MKYTIISRDEFLKLIKFGTIYKNINYIVDENNKENNLSNILKVLPYDDSFAYVIVEFTYEEAFSLSNIQTLIKLDIKDIINIYCLTNEALGFYKTKFNPNIKFKLFKNQELIKEVYSYKLIEDKKKGIKVLFEIFKFDRNNMNKKFNDGYIKELLEFKENNYLNQEYKDFYFDLFCYERKNSFFKEDIGIIADTRAIFRMQDIRKNKEVFLSGNYPNLSNEKDREKLKVSLKTLVVNGIDKVKNITKKNEEEKNETIKHLVIGAIFLKSQKLLNTESREENYWENFVNIVNEFKEEFLEETKESLWYLGIFLGYKYLYDDYYNFLDLNIFKEEEEQKNEFVESRQENEELSKKITPLEVSTQDEPINRLKEENEQLIKLLNEKRQSEKELKEEIERKNQEMLKQTQQLEYTSQVVSTIDNGNTNVETATEKEVHTEENDIGELAEKLNEKSNYKENNQEASETQNKRKFFDNETVQKESFGFTDEEINIFSLSHLKNIAKGRGVDLSHFVKKFPNSPEGKIALYKAIKASPKFDIED